MEYILIEKFKFLPIELIALIISYDNKLVYRNGKFIDRLIKDYRYDLLSTIIRPIYIGKTSALLRLINYNNFGYFLKYQNKDNLLLVQVRSFYKEKDGWEFYYDIRSDDTYIFQQNKWCKINFYTM